MILPAGWSVPASIKNRVGQTTYGRQRAIVEEGHLLLVLHKPPKADDTRREGALFWRTPTGEWQSSRGGSGLTALKRHVQSYAELEAQLTQRYESAKTVRELFDILEDVTPLSRAATNMHAALQAARDEIGADPAIIEARDLAYESDRNLNLLLEDVRNAVQYRTAREAEQQAILSREALQASHRLNILAALFLPLTALASLFGMNFAHGFNNDSPLIFWAVCLVSVGLGFAIKEWVVGNYRSGDTKLPPQPPAAVETKNAPSRNNPHST